MAEINRFEIGGIFYDCEDTDAQNKMAELAGVQRPMYARAEYIALVTVNDTTEKTVYTASRKCQLSIHGFAADAEGQTVSRVVSVFVNGTQLEALGVNGPYPGSWSLGTYMLFPGDVLSVRKVEASGNSVSIDGVAIPFGPAS